MTDFEYQDGSNRKTHGQPLVVRRVLNALQYLGNFDKNLINSDVRSMVVQDGVPLTGCL